MITEDQVEQLAIQWFQDTGWNYVHGAEIAPEGVAAEREDRRNIEHPSSPGLCRTCRTPNIRLRQGFDGQVERRSEEKKSLAEAVRRLNPNKEPSFRPSPTGRERKMAIRDRGVPRRGRKGDGSPTRRGNFLSQVLRHSFGNTNFCPATL